MKIFYTEYKDKVIFKNQENIVEIPRITLKKFLKAIYKKYGKNVKFQEVKK